jgi:hypothetical protein
MRIKTKPFFSGYLDNDGELKQRFYSFKYKGSYMRKQEQTTSLVLIKAI